MSERRVRRRNPRLKCDKQMYKKLGILFWIVVLALFALCTRIAYLNVAKGDNYSIKVLEQQSFTSKTIPYKRGDIKDRNGNVLATSVMVYNLIIDSKVVMSNEKYLTPTVNALVKYFDFNEDDLRTAIKERITLSIRIFKNLKVILITNMQIQKKRKPQFRIPKVFGLKKNTRECIRIIVWHVHY